MAAEQGAGTVIISAQIEEEISQLEADEADLSSMKWALTNRALIV